MGLYMSRFRFEGPRPDLDSVRNELRRRLGSLGGLEGLQLQGDVVVASSMLDPFTHPMLCAILEELGGQPLGLSGDQPIASSVPAWAHRPLRELRWRERMAIRLGWWTWLFGTVRR